MSINNRIDNKPDTFAPLGGGGFASDAVYKLTHWYWHWHWHKVSQDIASGMQAYAKRIKITTQIWN